MPLLGQNLLDLPRYSIGFKDSFWRFALPTGKSWKPGLQIAETVTSNKYVMNQFIFDFYSLCQKQYHDGIVILNLDVLRETPVALYEKLGPQPNNNIIRLYNVIDLTKLELSVAVSSNFSRVCGSLVCAMYQFSASITTSLAPSNQE
jgi:hypothetical protein